MLQKYIKTLQPPNGSHFNYKYFQEKKKRNNQTIRNLYILAALYSLSVVHTASS